MFQHNMVILSDTLDTECEAHRVTQEQLRDPWWPVIIGAYSIIVTKSQLGKLVEWKP